MINAGRVLTEKECVDVLLYLCAFTFMHIKMRAPIGVCKDVADRVLKNV